MNYGNNNVDFSNKNILFNMVAENIFKDFTQGNLPPAISEECA